MILNHGKGSTFLGDGPAGGEAHPRWGLTCPELMEVRELQKAITPGDLLLSRVFFLWKVADVERPGICKISRI